MKVSWRYSVKKDFVVALIILLSLVVFSLITWDCEISNSRVANIITWISLITMFIQVITLGKESRSLFSILPVFIVLLHIFHFGNFYISAFGKNEFYLFSDFLRSDVIVKYEAGLFSLCVIQALVVGMLSLTKESNELTSEFKFATNVNPETKERALWISGCVLLAISLPFRIKWDIHAIVESATNGIYSGISTSSGLSDDLQILFIPAIICLMSGKRSRPGFCKILGLFVVSCSLLVMLASGARRQYITGILAIALYMYNSLYSNQGKKINFGKLILFFVVGIVLLNLLFIIREYRKETIGVFNILLEHANELFSLDFLWESLAEYGLTGSTMANAVKYFPDTIHYQFGLTYLSAFIYILPIGWLVSIGNSVCGLLYSVTGNPLGGSILADLYGNFGFYSVLIAPFLGKIIAKIVNIGVTDNTIKSVAGFCIAGFILSYARGDAIEFLRPTAYTLTVICAVSLIIIKKR